MQLKKMINILQMAGFFCKKANIKGYGNKY